MKLEETGAGTASINAAEVAAPSGDRPKAEPSLLEQEATRFAESLDDYEHVSVTEVGGTHPIGYWLVVHDHRFDVDFEIASHCDYWEVLTALVRSLRAANSDGEKRKAS